MPNSWRAAWVVKQDIQKALFWYSKAADGGDPSAMFRYALILMEGRLVKQDKARADELMRKAADAGNPLAAFNWAQILVSKTPGRKACATPCPITNNRRPRALPTPNMPCRRSI